MKKLIAVILAVMMLGSVAAFADNAVFTLSDPILTVDTQQGSQTFDFTGLTLAVSPIADDEGLTIALNVLANDEPALVAAARLVGETVFVSMEGLSNTYYAEIPVQEAVSVTNDIDLSGVDMQALVATVMNELEVTAEGDTTYFKLPYTALNEVLETLAPVLGEALASYGVEVSGLEDAIAQFKESNSGVNLEGSFTSGDTGVSLSFDAYLVQNGQASADALVSINGYVNADDVQTFGEFEVSASTDGGAPQLLFAVSFSKGNEVPNCSVEVRLVPADTTVSARYDAESSVVELAVNNAGTFFDLRFVVGMSEGELAVCPLDEAGALNIQELSEEQMQQLQNEAVQAVSPLLSIVSQVVG